MVNFRSVKNPARWLLNFIRSIPNTDEAFAFAMRNRANGIENAGLRSIVGVHRASSEIVRIISAAYTDRPNLRERHLGWVPHLQAARECALRNQSASVVLGHASKGIASLDFCAATIEDVSPKQDDDAVDDPAVVLNKLKDFKATLIAQEVEDNPAKGVLLSAVDALIESLEIIEIIGFEGILDSITRSYIDFLMNAEIFKQDSAKKERDVFQELCGRVLESIVSASVYDIGKVVAVAAVARLFLQSS